MFSATIVNSPISQQLYNLTVILVIWASFPCAFCNVDKLYLGRVNLRPNKYAIQTQEATFREKFS